MFLSSSSLLKHSLNLSIQVNNETFYYDCGSQNGSQDISRRTVCMSIFLFLAAS